MSNETKADAGSWSVLKALGLAMLVLVLPNAALAGPEAAPPVARIEPVVDVYFGQSITDPYRWMEARGADFDAWMRGQDDVTRGDLRAAPGYAKLAAEVAALSAAAEVPIAPQIVGSWIFYKKRPQGTAQFKLFVAPLAGGTERLLVDPLVAPLGGPDGAIDEYAVSPDGTKLVFAISRGGSEESTLHVLDVVSGKPLSEAIDRTRFAAASWDPKGDAFYYNRLNPFTSGMAQSDRFKDEVVYRHVLGADPEKDARVFVVNEAGSALGRDGFTHVIVPAGSKWSFALVNSGVSPESEWWVAPTETLSRGKVPWRKFVSLEDKVGLGSVIASDPVVIGDAAYLLSFKDALNWRLLRYDLAHPEQPPIVAAPEGKGVLVGALKAKDGVYLVSSIGGAYALSRFDPASGKATAVATPMTGTIPEAASDPSQDGVVYALDSWTRPTQLYRERPGKGAAPLSLAKPFARDLSAYVSEELTATAADGTQVPVSVIYRKGLKRDGSAPAIVEAYGAYGVSIDAGFSPRLLAWYDRGGVYAVVHVRGGGEFGETWHLAGKDATKPNTWRDFIAGVTLLQKSGYTSPAKAAGWGTSAGGIMIGRTITERPDLLGAAIINVGLSDTLRFETSEGGPANVAEFGTVKTEAGFKALLEMSAYHHVKDGTAYPATLVTAGMNDHRVPAWEGGKMAARLQAAQAKDGSPIRLRVEFDAGHGMGSTKTQYDALYTDIMAFVLRATGAPDFAPAR
ncbi:prolyl oligopeptidase family serine peptidase [Caulobacter hibisci]|uniref:prolyl oligopeptidase n=1 Tax=Caulobacter hibisci TaxID=2035993 RepID=A0ABS0T201_9CAUL|nr:prolyl oligopeptidase family serine peptidase [Caulobacter hibisci]MBI1685910.1 prolyl oligopeptidase family serine peptidase [Caulobacter hibisci]